MVKKWSETGRKTLVTTRVFELQERMAVNPRTNKEIPFFVLDSVPWVNVVPLFDDRQILMVRQYRMGTQTTTVEIPGGMIEPGETPEEGARRELREETGYDATTLELIGVVDSNPAIQTNATYTFLARGLRKISEIDQDDAEDIEVLKVTLDQVDDWVRERKITHSLVIAAFYWLERHRDRHSRVQQVIDDLTRVQQDKVAALAKRINTRLTTEDLRNPQDFPELAQDPDFNYQDGMLAGIESARMALRRLG